MAYWQSKRVLVTGGGGFVGSHVIEKLRQRGCKNVFAPRSREFDLRETEAITQLYKQTHPDLVIHLAGVVGGIGANRNYPGRFFYENAIMGIQMLEYARRFGVEKFVGVGTICAYPRLVPIPFKEEDLWNGYPEETNAPYGIAKKVLLVQATAYRTQYGFNSIYLLPVNIYGPGDNFDLQSCHVIPALIRKCFEAQSREDTEIVAWGTGCATREFLYVEDAAEGILLASERYDKPEPANLGSGEEISIRDLANLIGELTGFQGKIRWDARWPDGQPRRCVDTSRAEQEFGFTAQTPLREGLLRTIDWYEVVARQRSAGDRESPAGPIEP